VNFAQFKASVRERLPLDANREGAQTLINRSIEAALIVIQRNCRGLRIPFTSAFASTDMDVEMEAGRLALPSGIAVVHDVAIVTYEAGLETGRTSLTSVIWDLRQHIIYGESIGYAMAPGRGVILFSPWLAENQKLVVEWEGLSTTFQETDSSPLFDERVAGAVSNFVSAELARRSDNDLQLAASFMQSWTKDLQSLFLDFKQAPVEETKKASINTATLGQGNGAAPSTIDGGEF